MKGDISATFKLTFKVTRMSNLIVLLGPQDLFVFILISEIQMIAFGSHDFHVTFNLAFNVTQVQIRGYT